MTRKLLYTMIALCFTIGIGAQTWHSQTDWSGGAGQTGNFTDDTKFDNQTEIDFSTTPGEIAGSYTTNTNNQDVIYYNGKIITSTDLGVFSYDTTTSQWDFIFDISINNFVVGDGTLYGYNSTTKVYIPTMILQMIMA